MTDEVKMLSDDERKMLTDKQLEEIRFDIKNTKPSSSLQGLFRQHCESLLTENTALREQLAEARRLHADAEEDYASQLLKVGELQSQLAQVTQERDKLLDAMNVARKEQP